MSRDLQKKVYEAADGEWLSFSEAPAYRLVVPRLFLAGVLAHQRGAKVLDVGGGSGLLLEPFVDRAKCHLVDISARLVRQATARGIEAVVADVDRGLPFVDGSFDVVLCSHVIEHTISTDRLLGELNRVLKKRGRLLLVFPNISQPVGWLMMVLLDLPPKHSARYKGIHVRDFTLRTVKAAVELNGFRVDKTRGSGMYPFMGGTLSAAVARLLPRFADDVTLLCTKVSSPSQTPAIVENVRQVFKLKRP
ncbi:MAG: class I SAM-dependent methyltransferase [Dehalococcoidia bacterium]|nr:class I SAM-dependent methyltransferase [Dehalococcoidia bacterium]